MSGTNFFDFREKMVARKQPAPPRDRDNPMTVSQLTAVIDRAIRSGVPAGVLVRGEVSNFSLHRGSGHLYFTLKDASACIDCVMFRSDAQRLKFEPGDGMELLASGRVGIYAQRGRYQFYVNSLNPLGKGAMELAIQQLRAKLEAEGLFAPERKKPLPRFPRNIVLVTSRQTAALHDMLKVLRAFPFLRVKLYHVAVQGDGAAGEIAAALKTLNRWASRIDVILLARGGGSLEDLWEFNQEIVARAISASKIPIVTGVGHEIDVSIADLVADYHAHTPTEAAQVIVSPWRSARDSIELIALRSRRGLLRILADAKQRLIATERHEFLRRPLDRINQLRQLLDDRQRTLLHGIERQMQLASGRVERASVRLSEMHPRHRVRLLEQRLRELRIRLNGGISRSVERNRSTLAAMEAKLGALSPESVLKRGYSMTTLKKSGQIVRSTTQVKTGDRLTTRLADGSIESVAEDQKQLPLFE